MVETVRHDGCSARREHPDDSEQRPFDIKKPRSSEGSEAGLVGGTPAGAIKKRASKCSNRDKRLVVPPTDNPQEAIRVRANDHAVAIYKGGPNNSNEPRETPRRPQRRGVNECRAVGFRCSSDGQRGRAALVPGMWSRPNDRADYREVMRPVTTAESRRGCGGGQPTASKLCSTMRNHWPVSGLAQRGIRTHRRTSCYA